MLNRDFNNYKNELYYFLQEYLLPLMGFPKGKIEISFEKTEKVESTSHIFNDKLRIPFSSSEEKGCFVVSNSSFLKDDVDVLDLGLFNNIFAVFKEICNYDRSNNQNKKNINYLNYQHREESYKLAVELGICRWLAKNNTEGDRVHKLLTILEDWSSKTYEGKKVSFAIVIDTGPLFEKSLDEEENFLKFLGDEYSATLTDCITSAFKINLRGKLIDYLSIIEDEGIVKEYRLINNLPIRFASIIQKHIIGDNLGVFLLNNGDIIIAKKQRVLFVKRNGRWLNFSFRAFYNCLNGYDYKLIDEIFSTVIDVSFSHSGGLVAVLNDDSYYQQRDKNEAIIDSFDLIDGNFDTMDLVSRLEKKNIDGDEIKNEVEKRRIKKEIIHKLLKYNNTQIVFTGIERKLRSDLVALDGACVLDKEGRVITFGAIIQNDSGSSGGGRSAAAKKLSLKGFAVKISTDGYIELFVGGKKQYSIK